MTRYFVAGNFWLAFALLMVLGRVHERSSPDFYSFFGTGWYSESTYSFLTLLCAAAGIVFSALAWRTRPIPGGRSKPAISSGSDEDLEFVRPVR